MDASTQPQVSISIGVHSPPQPVLVRGRVEVHQSHGCCLCSAEASPPPQPSAFIVQFLVAFEVIKPCESLAARLSHIFPFLQAKDCSAQTFYQAGVQPPSGENFITILHCCHIHRPEKMMSEGTGVDMCSPTQIPTYHERNAWKDTPIEPLSDHIRSIEEGGMQEMALQGSAMLFS